MRLSRSGRARPAGAGPATMAAMIGRLHHVILDGQDPAAPPPCYSELLGLPVTYRSDAFVVVSAGGTSSGLAFQLAPDHQPPALAGPAPPPQMHLAPLVGGGSAPAPRGG